MIKYRFNLKKNAEISFVLVSVIIIIMTFLLYIMFFTSMSDIISQKSDDIACNTFLSAKETSVYKIVDFFVNVNLYCKQDQIIIKDYKKDEEVFEKIADSMSRCWYRYGEGEYDFMGNFDTDGNWCFVCAQIDFDESLANKKKMDYLDFVKWSNENYVDKSLIEESVDITYFDYFNMKYTDVSNDQIKEIGEEISTLSSSENNIVRDFMFILSDEYVKLQNLRLKEIDPSSTSYVVYRFDRIDSDLQEKMASASKGAIVAGIGSFIISEVLESCLTFGIGFLKAPFKIIDSANNIDKVHDVSKLSSRLASWFKLSKKTAKANNNLIDTAKFADVVSDLSKKSIQSINDIDKIEDSTTLVKLADDVDIILDAFKNSENERDFISKLDNINKITVLDSLDGLKQVSNQIKSADDVQKTILLKKKIKLGITAANIVAGAYYGSKFDDNSNQYVDILTKEEYFRECGTMRFEK